MFRGRGEFIDVYKADDKIATSDATSLADNRSAKNIKSNRQCRYWVEYLIYSVSFDNRIENRNKLDYMNKNPVRDINNTRARTD